jgi:hypothetical protein
VRTTPNRRTRRKGKEVKYNFNDSFWSQNVKISDYIFMPEGMEAYALMFYFLTIPYGLGLIVVYLFIAQGNIGNFLVLDFFTIVPVWSIGYETLAGLIMLKVIYSAFEFNAQKRKYMAKRAEEQKKMKKRNPSKYDILKNYS